MISPSADTRWVLKNMTAVLISIVILTGLIIRSSRPGLINAILSIGHTYVNFFNILGLICLLCVLIALLILEIQFIYDLPVVIGLMGLVTWLTFIKAGNAFYDPAILLVGIGLAYIISASDGFLISGSLLALPYTAILLLATMTLSKWIPSSLVIGALVLISVAMVTVSCIIGHNMNEGC